MPMKRIIRVFPRRTRATPEDILVRVGEGPRFMDEADEIHISVTFTWDLKKAESLAKLWKAVAPVKIGGPATGEPGGPFTPGLYMKRGYVITSRGCPNRCWYCYVWKRDGQVRELPVTEGWMVQDDNLLACSDGHILKVFDMLSRQSHRPEFTGGLEARLLKPWHVAGLKNLRPKQLFFAYDIADDLPYIQQAGRLLREGGFNNKGHFLRCYVLCGYPKDTFDQATKRMNQAMEAGFTPSAMLYLDGKPQSKDWKRFHRVWMRPAIMYAGKHSSPKGIIS